MTSAFDACPLSQKILPVELTSTYLSIMLFWQTCYTIRTFSNEPSLY